MKEYEIIIDGEHVAFERRELKFWELQKNKPVGGIDVDFDNGEFGKWFRLDTVTISVVEYDENGDSKTIAVPYRKGHIADDGFVQEFCEPSSRLRNYSCERVSGRISSPCYGEIQDRECFSIDRLKIYKGVKRWGDDEQVICLIGFEYDGKGVVLADEVDPDGYVQTFNWGWKEVRLDDACDIYSAFQKLGFAEESAISKECIEVKDKTGRKKWFYRIGYEVEREDEGVMICVDPRESPETAGAYSKGCFRCYRVKEWKVIQREDPGSDEKGEYIVVDPDVDLVAEIEKTDFYFNLESDSVEICEDDGIDPVEISSIDRGKAIADISEGRVNAETCVRLLHELDVHGVISRSNVTDECLSRIWRSKDVPCNWKYETLRSISDRKCRHMENVLLIPVEFNSCGRKMLELTEDADDDDLVDHILSLLYTNDFARLDELVASGKLAAVEDRWSEIVLRFMLFGVYYPYDELDIHGTAYMDNAIPWIEDFRPGLLAKAADRYGNNILVYVYAAMIMSMSSSQHYWAYDEARIVLEFLEKFGCDGIAENCFGVSASMLFAGDNRDREKADDDENIKKELKAFFGVS